MRLLWLATGVVLLWFETVRAGDPIVVGHDGSITGPIFAGTAEQKTVTIHFALPKTPPLLRSEDKGVLQTTWVTNGVKYVQTVFVTGVPRSDVSTSGAAALAPVLVVRIEGENSNSEYTEATAELVIQTAGRQQELELKNGLVWHGGDPSVPVAALEIPESGIRVASGSALKFSGNMPPSIKGSMTLKIPLHGMVQKMAHYVTELDFEEELRRVSKVSASNERFDLRLMFAEKLGAENANTPAKPSGNSAQTK